VQRAGVLQQCSHLIQGGKIHLSRCLIIFRQDPTPKGMLEGRLLMSCSLNLLIFIMKSMNPRRLNDSFETRRRNRYVTVKM